jgi:hypothetical protein
MSYAFDGAYSNKTATLHFRITLMSIYLWIKNGSSLFLMES